MLSNLILGLAISFAVGLNGITKNENNNFNNDINVNNVNHTINNKVDTSESSSEVSYPIYDDLAYTITLNYTQLNTYVWDNLYNLIENDNYNDDLTNTHISYNGLTFNYLENFTFLYDENSQELYISLDFYTQKFSYTDGGEGLTLTFEYPLNIELNANSYSNIKSAIQADIQVNEQTGTMGDNIIDAITSGLGLIGDLAKEFLTGFSTLFWDATANNNAGALTPFGQFALVMLGVAITMAVISLVLALIKGNTGA